MAVLGSVVAGAVRFGLSSCVPPTSFRVVGLPIFSNQFSSVPLALFLSGVHSLCVVFDGSPAGKGGGGGHSQDVRYDMVRDVSDCVVVLCVRCLLLRL